MNRLDNNVHNGHNRHEYTNYKPLNRNVRLAGRKPLPTDVTFENIIDRSVGDRTSERYTGVGKWFEDWLAVYRANGNYIPSTQQLKSGFQVVYWVNIVAKFLTDRFNDTHNIGNTLASNLDALLHYWGVNHGFFLTRRHFPFLKKFVKGCNNIAHDKFGKKVQFPKFAIINPQLEAMLKITKNRDLRMGMLFQQRFVLRAEHYTKTYEDKQWLTIGDVAFFPSIQDPKHMRIVSRRDKNHRYTTYNQRTCVCTCKTEWTCVVHEMAGYLMPRWKYKHQAIIYRNHTAVTYDFMLDGMKAVVKDLKLDPTNYGTHSFRAGGATELHCEGRDIVEIQHFGHWKSMDSAQGYLRPWNADLYQFIRNWEEYKEKRRKQNPFGIGARTVVFVSKKPQRMATV